MASGVPVVATAVNAVADVVIPGETGLLVPPAWFRLLAEALRYLLDSASRRPDGGRPRQARHLVYRGRAVRRAAGGVRHRTCFYHRDLGQLA
jgi:glycosyltransferase involved in cell wall biosynthesis